jgi:tetratricopeptide (TPR) repeat protein
LVTIGCHLIVKGDFDKIGPCLESQKGFADYFSVAVDCRAEDNKVYELCKSIVGKGVYRQPWPRNIAQARNWSLEHLLRHYPDVNYVYWTDADDLFNADHKMLRQRVEDVKPSAVVNTYAYHPTLWHDRTRLWKVVDGKSSRKWVGAIHEVNVPALEVDGPVVRWSDWVTLHTRDTTNPLRHFDNIEIAEEALKAIPEDTRTMLNLAREYTFIGYYAEAIKWLKEYLTHKTYWSEQYQVFFELALIYLKIQDAVTAKKYLHNAILLNQDIAYAPIVLADIHREAGELVKAAYWYKHGLECKNEGAIFDYKLLKTQHAAKWYAFCLRELGKPNWEYWENLYTAA